MCAGYTALKIMFGIYSTHRANWDQSQRMELQGLQLGIRTGGNACEVLAVLPVQYKHMYRTHTLMLMATALVAQLVERWFRDPGSWIKQFPVGDLEVAFFATGPRWVLKNIYNINIYIYIYTCIYIYN